MFVCELMIFFVFDFLMRDVCTGVCTDDSFWGLGLGRGAWRF